MANSPKAVTEQIKEATIQKLWLTYYNETLYAKGVISESERNRMKVRINSRATTMNR